MKLTLFNYYSNTAGRALRPHTARRKPGVLPSRCPLTDSLLLVLVLHIAGVRHLLRAHLPLQPGANHQSMAQARSRGMSSSSPPSDGLLRSTCRWRREILSRRNCPPRRARILTPPRADGEGIIRITLHLSACQCHSITNSNYNLRVDPLRRGRVISP